MRLIDADALKRLVDDEWFDCQEKSSFFDEIDRTPTIDPADNGGCWGCRCAYICKMDSAPVMIGKWIEHVKDYWCSECGGRIQKEQVEKFSICPYCGARMDGE